MIYQNPAGSEYYTLYANMAEQPHLLVAGATGSGKSVVINGILHALLTQHTPQMCRLILIDPKRVELVQYKALPHTVAYASEPGEYTRALKLAMDITEDRFRDMARRGLRKYDGGDVYVVIDELADLMLTEKKTAQPLLQRLAQLGRAARVHILMATQCPLTTVISTPIKCNIDSRVGLRTRSSQDSRNILGVSCCENLPRYGYGYYMTPDGCSRYALPMVSEEMIDKLIKYWTSKACIVA